MAERLQFRGFSIPLPEPDEAPKGNVILRPGIVEIRKTTVEAAEKILDLLQRKHIGGIEIEARSKDDIRIYFPEAA